MPDAPRLIAERTDGALVLFAAERELLQEPSRSRSTTA